MTGKEWLGRGTMRAEMRDDLMESVQVSEASIADVLATQVYERGESARWT
jgi:hypothetical protein